MMKFKKEAARLTYIWLAGKNSHHDIRCKDRTMYFDVEAIKSDPKKLLADGVFPVWNFDGSSTGQALTLDTEVLLKPVNAFPCCLPHHSKDLPWILVLSECFFPNGKPTPDNTRALAREIFDELPEERPWFGLEQEYFIMKNQRPYGWPEHGFPPPQGPYYCSTGSTAALGRQFADEHYETCLKMGLDISGTNAEVTPAQWEFQVGPCGGLEIGDQMTIARWVLLRILENYGLDVDYSAKPFEGDWNGSGMHANISTESTRAENGIEAINKYIDRLKTTVKKDIVFYGHENDKRLTGKHETAKATEFTFGIGTRGTSIRIPNSVAKSRKGYFEDRRPAGDADPYLVTSRLFASCLGLETPSMDLISPIYQKDWMNKAFQ